MRAFLQRVPPSNKRPFLRTQNKISVLGAHSSKLAL